MEEVFNNDPSPRSRPDMQPKTVITFGILHSKKRFRAIALSLWALALTLVFGCEPRSPKQEMAATDAVLMQLESVAKPDANPKDATSQNTSMDNAANSDVAKLVDDFGSDQKATEAASPPSATSTKKPANPIVSVDDPSKPWTTADQLPRDIWEVQYKGNLPVGYLHRRTEVSKTQGKKVFRIEAEGETRVSIQGQKLIQKLRVTTLEQDNGDLISMEGALEVGETKQTFKGSVLSGVLRLTSTNNGKVAQVNVDWKDSFRGPFAVEQSLLRTPIQERESRKLKYFDPILVRMVDGSVEAEEFVSTPTMLGGTRELLEVRNIAAIGETGLKSLIWVDRNGEGYKSLIASADIRSFRTQPEAAQSIASIFELQTLETRAIPLQGAVQALQDGTLQDSRSFRVTHQSKDPFQLFSDRTNQRIRSIDAKSADVTVLQVNSKNGSGSDDSVGGNANDGRVDPSNLASTQWIPTSSPFVSKLAKALLASNKEVDAKKASVLEIVQSCQKELFSRIQYEEFDNQIQSISQIIRAKKANAVEHAMVLTAVCRSLNVPARIAFGYKYNGSSDMPAMRFHAWVEYQDQGKWFPIDSSEQESAMQLDRIKVSESSFADDNPYAPFMNVFRMMPETEIKVLPK